MVEESTDGKLLELVNNVRGDYEKSSWFEDRSIYDRRIKEILENHSYVGEMKEKLLQLVDQGLSPATLASTIAKTPLFTDTGAKSGEESPVPKYHMESIASYVEIQMLGYNILNQKTVIGMFLN